ncbi:MAG: hypothetical protein U0165_12740 [Polyangiaceae bacterium]
MTATAKKRLLIAGALLGALLITAALCAHPLVRWLVIEQASARGVLLTFDDLSLSLTSITLKNARGSIKKIPHVVAEAPEIRLNLVGPALSSVHVKSARVAADGPVVETLKNVSSWKGSAGDLVPATIDALSFSWLRWRQCVVDGFRGSFKNDGSVSALDLAEVKSASMTVRDAHVVSESGKPTELSAGAPVASAAPFKLYLTNTPDLATLKLTLPPTTGAVIQKALGVELPGKNPILEGEIGLKDADGPAPVSSVRAVLKGYVPAHPKEIDGLVNGGQTTLASTLRLDRNTGEVMVDDTTVGVGSLVFKGKGRIEGKDTYALLHMALHGSIPCSSLVQGAAAGYGPLGEFVGGLAAGAVQGSVAVTLNIEADSRKLSAAKVGTSVGVGCGFKGFGSD